jgi:hypothetical protein
LDARAHSCRCKPLPEWDGVGGISAEATLSISAVAPLDPPLPPRGRGERGDADDFSHGLSECFPSTSRHVGGQNLAPRQHRATPLARRRQVPMAPPDARSRRPDRLRQSRGL